MKNTAKKLTSSQGFTMSPSKELLTEKQLYLLNKQIQSTQQCLDTQYARSSEKLEIIKGIDKIENLSAQAEKELKLDKGYLLQNSYATYTVKDEEQTIGYYGIMAESFLARDRYFWSLLRKEAFKRPMPILRKLKKTDLKLPKYNKIITWIDDSISINKRFVEWQGFKPTNETHEVNGIVYRVYEVN